MLTPSLFLQEPRFYTQESLLWLFVCFIKVDTFYILMGSNEPDPDALRWGLLDLQVCTLTNAGSCGSVTRYEAEPVAQGYVREGYNQPLTGNYADNDAVIAQFYQDELSRVERAEEESHLRRSDNPSRISVASQEWPHHPLQGEAVDISDMEDKNVARTARDDDDDDSDCSVEIEEESWSLDSEVGKRMNQMIPIAHVPKINGELPSEDEQVSDHERLFQRLQLYGLVENKIEGDGNCQFRSLSDQLYRSSEHHNFVREQVVNQLAYNREMYEGYVPMAYTDYLKTMKRFETLVFFFFISSFSTDVYCVSLFITINYWQHRNGEWGDHVTLQAAADWYGVRMFVITSFKDTCYIEILPHLQKSNRLICLSFWAEVHYNSIYPEGELPVPEGKKKKKYWVF
ncbi:OVARIAN TUMOR DOMAIN-containing deubiquitinating enzyme 9 isoform X1 [Brassica napus]|uniref:OVARIAN TUMOR DOMAIN-containing deubiquitinating enzyme 9 isoform X1 n=2 Tax=Brassica napus TaxID=3708 RepID=UPI00207AB269|nr:OVARIAN TUMOR DOMAIN-containing deubiquitinating enzyme 9 isoform X1 [Brassica napus]